MRLPDHGDVVSAARVLLSVHPGRREWVLMRMLREADMAEGHFRGRHRAHWLWGDGTLMSSALRRRPAREPRLSDQEYCRCLAMVYAELAAGSNRRRSSGKEVSLDRE